MADFFNEWWGIWIGILVIISILGCAVLLWSQSKITVPLDADGKGNQALGAPNLTDKTWLYGGDINTIMEGINLGHNNHMPAHKDLLSDAKIHLLTAYVWSLSNASGLEAIEKQKQ